MNIDWSKPSSSFTSQYKGVIDLFGLSQLIAEPTRVTPTSSTIIDHVLVNSMDKVGGFGVISCGLSDHFMTFVSRAISKEVFNEPVYKRVRSFKSYSVAKFVGDLSKVDWSGVLFSDNVDFCLDEFSRLFRGVIDKVAPFREIRIKQRTNPWMNSQILAKIRKRDELLSKFKRDRNDSVLYK